jgi:hypothetical protein
LAGIDFVRVSIVTRLEILCWGLVLPVLFLNSQTSFDYPRHSPLVDAFIAEAKMKMQSPEAAFQEHLFRDKGEQKNG